MTTDNTHDEHGWMERPGATIEIQWLTVDAAYGRRDATFTATLLCVDRLGTCTYREGDRLGIAGAGSWRYVARTEHRSAPQRRSGAAARTAVRARDLA